MKYLNELLVLSCMALMSFEGKAQSLQPSEGFVYKDSIYYANKIKNMNFSRRQAAQGPMEADKRKPESQEAVPQVNSKGGKAEGLLKAAGSLLAK